MHVFAQKRASSLDRLVNSPGGRRAGGILEANAVERNLGVEDFLYFVLVKSGCVRAAAVDPRGKTHHGD